MSGLIQTGATAQLSSGALQPTIAGVASGNQLICVFSTSTSVTLSAPTDSAGQIWSILYQSSAGGNTICIAYLASANSGTHTLTWSSESSPCGAISEWNGITAYDTNGTVQSSGGATTATVAAWTQAQADEILIGICASPGVGTNGDFLSNSTPPTGWTGQLALQNDVSGSFSALEACYYVSSSTAGKAVTWNWNDSSNFTANTVGFKYSATTSATVAATDAADACAAVADTGATGASVATTDAPDAAAVSAIVPTIGEIMVGTKVNGTTSVSNLAMPAAAVNGDVLLAFIVDHGTSGTTAAPNAGWSNVGATAAAAGRFQVFKGVVGQGSIGSSPWTWTGLTTRSMGRIIAYHGADQTTPIDVTVSARNNASGTTGAASITPVTAGAKIVAAYASLANGTTWSAEACATQPTLAEWADSANSTYCSLAIADGLETTAGATGDSSATMNVNAANAGMLIALRPAAVAAAIASVDAPDVADVEASVAVETDASIATVDASDTAVVAVTVTTGAATAVTDASDTAALATTVTTGGTVAATDGHDTAAVGASVNVGTIAATDGADVSAIATTVTTGATVAATDASDVAAVSGAGTVGSIAATDAADTAAVAVTVTTGAAVAASDAPDVASVLADASLGVTSGTIATADAADTAAVAVTVTTGADLALTDAPDVAAAEAQIIGTVECSIASIDAPDQILIGADAGGVSKPQDAGRHHKRRRYAVRDGERLLIFDTPSQAQAARDAIQARQARSTHAARKPLPIAPRPAEVVELPQLQSLAGEQGAQAEFERLLADRKLSDLIALHERLQQERAAVADARRKMASEEEEIAMLLLHQSTVHRDAARSIAELIARALQ